MLLLHELYEGLQGFVETGGDVLLAIFGATLVMWTMMLERVIYLWLSFPREARQARASWRERAEQRSWAARQIRAQLVAQLAARARRSLGLIATLVALCPLLGLLGTVSGMIEVFDIMALVGSGNTRAMAAGVSMATIPTMAGMVAALSGLFLSVRLQRKAESCVARFDDSLAS